MKPILLTLENFGPYEHETIDFTSLHSKMFLITGPTGSGKSMIFNAIIYALYGIDTKIRTYRSQFAKEDEKSRVVLDFEVGNQSYTIERTLGIPREEKTDVPPKALIRYKDGDVIDSGLTSVAEVVESIIHLDATQFKQILLLPQGKFKEFLVSKSEDKSQILKTLFRTERFEAFEEKINGKAQEKRQVLHQSQREIEQLFQHIKLERLSDDVDMKLIPEARDLESKLKFIEDVNSKLQDIINEKTKSYEESEKELQTKLEQLRQDELHNKAVDAFKALEKEHQELLKHQEDMTQLEELINKYDRSQRVSYEVKSYHQLMHDSKQLNTDIKVLETDIDVLKEEETTADNKLTALDSSKKDIEDKQTYINKTMRFIGKDDYKNLEDEQSHIIKRIEEIDNDKLEVEAEIKSLESVASFTDKDDVLLEGYNEKVLDIKRNLEFQSSLLRYKETIENVQDIEKNRQHLLDEYEKLDDTYAHLSNTERSAIQTLRQHLQVGEQCLVCEAVVKNLPLQEINDTDNRLNEVLEFLKKIDSELHNAKMKQELLKESLGDINEQELSNVTEKMELLKVEESDLLKTITTLKEKRRHARDAQTSLLEKHNILKQLEIDANKLNSTLLQIKDRHELFKEETSCSNYNEFETMYTNAQEVVTQYQKDKETLTEKLQDVKTKYIKLTARLTSKQEQLKSANEKIRETYSIINDFMKKENYSDIDTLTDVIETKDINSKRQTLKEYNKRINDIVTLQQQHESNGTTEYREIEESRKLDLDKLKEQQQSLYESITLTKEDIKTNTALEKQLTDKESSMQSLLTEYEKLERIAEAIVGKNKIGISLHRFVQTYYLNQILALANIRLNKMTNSRYTLIRTDETKRAGSKAGLEIKVKDAYTNTERHIETLSGGETFQASLALALALNEAIIQNAGGITLDTILIDEGFGTLDAETLNNAIESLLSLETKGKMVGIISHVEELKHRIPYQLKVEPDNEKSRTYLTT